MKISRDWLQTFFTDPLPESSVIGDALTFHAFEIDSIENDVLDVKVTPNRGHDCLSYRGIAKELSAILQLPMKIDPLRHVPELNPESQLLQVQISEPSLCKRYIAGYIQNVKVGPSPEWLVQALESMGQRSINNVVDAANYVMFHIGQPLHAFDADKLEVRDGVRHIDVRLAADGEQYTALDNKEYVLKNTMLVIADGVQGRTLGAAGVKGGKYAEVNVSTKNLIIEAANFDGVSLRRTAQALKFRTDASARFEQVISPEVAAYGMKLFVELILASAGGEVEGFTDVYPVAAPKVQASVSTQQVNLMLGTAFQPKDISGIFDRLGLAHAEADDVFHVTVPFERLDITTAEDLIEEVARIAGYEHVPEVVLPVMPASPEISKNFYYTERVREFLLSRGFSEIFTPVFTLVGEKAVLNKVDSDTPFLRRDLMGGLREALDKNVRNKDLFGLKQVRLFEIGTVWRDDSESVWIAIAVEKVKKEEGAQDILSALGTHLGITVLASDVASEVLEIPLESVVGSQPTPESYEKLSSISDVRYQPFSRYPFIVRDIALWVPGDTSEEKVLETIRNAAGSMLVRSAAFDRFEKEGRISLAFRLVFQSFDKTLTDGDVSERMASVNAAVQANGWEVR